MSLGRSRIRRIGRWAAFVAAYALVFNVMLTSTLLASISPLDFNARQQLCFNSTSANSANDKGEPGKPMVRCPVCLASAVAAADLPPLSPALAIRVALHVPFETSSHDVFIVRLLKTDYQPRGPPHLS